MSNNECVSLAVVIILLILGVYFYYNKVTYKCLEGNCVMSIYGDYKSKGDCLSACNKQTTKEVSKPARSAKKKSKKKSKKVNFNLPVIERSEEVIMEERDTSYICDNTNTCVEVPGKSTGPFTTPEACVSNCSKPIQQTYYYQPQSLYYHRRPNYWNPRRNHRCRGGGGGGGGRECGVRFSGPIRP